MEENLIKIAICEKNLQIANITRQAIVELFASSELTNARVVCDLKIYVKGEDLINSKQEYDIIIQDLNFGDNLMDGYDVARWVNKNYEMKPFIIILSCQTNCAAQSYDFDIRAFSFIEKRLVNHQKLQEAVLHAVREIIDTLGVIVKIVSSGEKFFRASDIRYIQKDGNETIVHVTNGTSYPTSLTLDEWTKKLPRLQFLKTHKSNIVNLDYIIGFSRDKKRVILTKEKEGEFVKATRDKFNEFTSTILKHERYLAKRNRNSR